MTPNRRWLALNRRRLVLNRRRLALNRRWLASYSAAGAVRRFECTRGWRVFLLGPKDRPACHQSPPERLSTLPPPCPAQRSSSSHNNTSSHLGRYTSSSVTSTDAHRRSSELQQSGNVTPSNEGVYGDAQEFRGSSVLVQSPGKDGTSDEGMVQMYSTDSGLVKFQWLDVHAWLQVPGAIPRSRFGGSWLLCSCVPSAGGGGGLRSTNFPKFSAISQFSAIFPQFSAIFPQFPRNFSQLVLTPPPPPTAIPPPLPSAWYS